MDSAPDFEVEITGLKYSKRFFKVFARQIRKMWPKSELELNFDLCKVDSLCVGSICIVKLDDHSYERCRILQINSFENRATVHLIDCGINAKVPTNKASLSTFTVTLNDANNF